MAEQLMGGYTVEDRTGGQAASAGIMRRFWPEGNHRQPYVLEGTELKGALLR